MNNYRVPPPRAPDLLKLAAREAGQTKFIGSRCIHGHSGLRYVSTGNCVDCMYDHYDRNLTKRRAA